MLTYGRAFISFFCGQMCKLETLCKKVTFSVIRTFYFQIPQKNQRRLPFIVRTHTNGREKSIYGYFMDTLWIF